VSNICNHPSAWNQACARFTNRYVSFAKILGDSTMKKNICSTCCGDVKDGICSSCGWNGKDSLTAWMLIHLSLLLLAINWLNGVLV